MARNHVTNFFALTAFTVLLTACATPAPPPEPVAVPLPAHPEIVVRRTQLSFRLASGVYFCELGERVDIQRDATNANLIQMIWKGKRYALLRYDSTSGLPRYEDRQKGLLWIDLPWKGVLMDSNSGRPLANECKAKT